MTPSRVVILRAAGDDEVLAEAATRLQAELRAAGFEVVLMDPAALGEPGPARPAGTPAGSGGDLRERMDRAAQGAGAFAAASLSRSAAGATVDLWIVDRVTKKMVVRSVTGAGASAPSVLAVRAVELLQASLLEASARRSDEPIPGDVERWIAPPPLPPAPALGLLEGVTMAAGVALLQSADGIGPAVGPALRVSLGARRGPAPPDRTALSPASPGAPASFAGRLTVAGPALAPALAGEAGTVSVRQELALLELVYAFPARGPLVPVLSAGAGAYHLHIAGAPDPPLRAAEGDVWAALAGAGAGVGLRLTERAALLADAQVLFTQPRPVVQLASEMLGTAGRPTFAGFLGLLARL
jgi:hypothetical protein